MKTLTNITQRDIGAIMANVGCAERMSRIEKLMLFAQERVLLSIREEAAASLDADITETVLPIINKFLNK